MQEQRDWSMVTRVCVVGLQGGTERTEEAGDLDQRAIFHSDVCRLVSGLIPAVISGSLGGSLR